jgi:hypothetical protein
MLSIPEERDAVAKTRRDSRDSSLSNLRRDGRRRLVNSRCNLDLAVDPNEPKRLIQTQNRFAILIADPSTSLKWLTLNDTFQHNQTSTPMRLLAPLGKTTLAESPKHRHATRESQDKARRLWNHAGVLNRDDPTV